MRNEFERKSLSIDERRIQRKIVWSSISLEKIFWMFVLAPSKNPMLVMNKQKSLPETLRTSGKSKEKSASDHMTLAQKKLTRFQNTQPPKFVNSNTNLPSSSSSAIKSKEQSKTSLPRPKVRKNSLVSYDIDDSSFGLVETIRRSKSRINIKEIQVRQATIIEVPKTKGIETSRSTIIN